MKKIVFFLLVSITAIGCSPDGSSKKNPVESTQYADERGRVLTVGFENNTSPPIAEPFDNYTPSPMPFEPFTTGGMPDP